MASRIWIERTEWADKKEEAALEAMKKEGVIFFLSFHRFRALGRGVQGKTYEPSRSGLVTTLGTSPKFMGSAKSRHADQKTWYPKFWRFYAARPVIRYS